MTEADWLASADPLPMMEFLGVRASDRKFRLFQVACCRRIWDVLPNDTCREAVLVAERYADGEASDRKRRAAQKAVAEVPRPAHLIDINAQGAAFRANEKTVGRKPIFLGVAMVYGRVAHEVAERVGNTEYKAAYQAEQAFEAGLLRDVFGNPFRPVTVAPQWLTAAVRGLAEAVYHHRSLPEGTLDPTRLSILADALEDAGCTDETILSHCRGPGVHVRGCWPVDLLLGRS